MKKSVKLGAIILFLGTLAVMLVLALSPAGGSDPTGASYVAATGTETLTDVATTANKGYYGANLHLDYDNRIYGFLLPMWICNG